MRKSIITLIVLTLSCISLYAGEIKVHPIPQQIQGGNQTVQVKAIRLIGGEQADPEAVKKLRELFEITTDKKAYPVYIGEKGDKAVKKYNSRIPAKDGAYYLNIGDKQMVIAGNEGRGTFYALQTLAQLLQQQELPLVEITDFPSVPYRGTVEGFYGQPWSHRDRISQLEFYGANKLNTYIYGPKDDPFHSSPNWRKPYPEKEAGQIRELVETAKANKVDFVWAIHPGQDIKWNDADRKLLLDKFEWMYRLGVRSFAVFFDDISGEGTDPNRQAELLNYLHQNFVKAKKDVTPLIMCPTQYNKSWADPKPGTYLDILGDKLDPSIRIMWTGDRVISDITTEGLQWINKRLKREAYIWWNFPVSDYVRDHLLLGRSYGLDTTSENLMSGFVSNPMDKPEASKIAIYSIADYAWNTPKYNSYQNWEDAIRYIMPETAGAFRTFAEHNSDLGRNGHGYRREESVKIKPVADRFLTNLSQNEPIDTKDLVRLKIEFVKIEKAPGILIAGNENPALIDEIRPWLSQFQILGQAGQASLNLMMALNNQNPDPVNCWNQYSNLLRLEAQKDRVSTKNNQNPYQPGVKTGSLVMQPLVDATRLWNAEQLYKHLNPGQEKAESTIQTQARLVTDIEQLKQVQLQTADQNIIITPLLEVVKINARQYFAIELPIVVTQGSIQANLNNKEVAEWGKIEISEDGNNWQAVDFALKGTNFTAKFENLPAKMVRFKNNGTATREFHLRKFILQSEQLSGKGGNSLTALDGDLNTSFTLSGTQTFAKNIDKVPAQVTILTAPNPQTNFSVWAIDNQNRKQKLGRVLTAFASFDLPANTTAIEIGSPSDIDIHEIIWK